MPPGESGDVVNIGSTSFPMHISAKTKNPDLAAAYLDWITGPSAAQALVDTQQVPAATDATAEPGDPLGKEVKDGWDELVEDGGLTLYPDWSSPTMLQTMGQTFQEMLAGRISPAGRDLAGPGRLGGVPPGARGGLDGGGGARHAGCAPRAPRRGRGRARAAHGARPRARRAAPGRLPVPRARVRLLPAVRVRPARSTRRGCRSSTGTGSRSARGSASTTTTRS